MIPRHPFAYLKGYFFIIFKASIITGVENIQNVSALNDTRNIYHCARWMSKAQPVKRSIGSWINLLDMTEP